MSVKRLEVVIAGLRAEIASLAKKASKKKRTLRKHIKALGRLKTRYAERDAKQG
jgi:hypothetical protein